MEQMKTETPETPHVGNLPQQRDDAGAAEALRALAQGTENRSKIESLRGVYDEIEKAQRAGASNSKIVETLNGQGFNLTLKTFETTLYRIRQERAKQAAPAQPVERPGAATPALVAPSTEVGEAAQDAIRPAAAAPQVKGQGEAEHDDDQEGIIKGVRPADGKTLPAHKEGYEPPLWLLNNRFVLGENGEYRRVGEARVALVDEVEQIRFIDKQMDTFQAGIELAKAKEWQAIQVTGTEKFRGEAWFHARMAGLEVVGYEPQEKDMERLEAAQRRQERDGKATGKPSEAVQVSQKAAENFVLDRGAGLQVANNAMGRYVGPVVHETEHHFVQEIGRGMAALHEKSRFPEAELAKIVHGRGSAKIQYQEGRVVSDAAHDRDRGHSR